MILLAGCAGGSSMSPVASTPAQAYASGQALLPSTQLATAKSFAGTVWVTDAGTNSLYKCTAKACASVPDPSGVGWSELQGLAADAKGNVYVADTANSRVVVVSKTGAKVAVLADPGQYPVGVAVNPKGVIGVSNIISTSGGHGSVAFYASLKATSPTSSATGLLGEVESIGCDDADNFYVDGPDAQTGAIDVGVATPSRATIGNTGIDTSGWTYPGGIQVGSTDHLLNISGAPTGIQQYKLPRYKDVGSVPISGVGGFALSKDDKDLWTTDAGTTTVDEYSFPAGKLVYTIPGGGFSEPISVVAVPTGDY
jgi:hypothetical protein